ncbi:AsmA family protein [Reyranella sp. CPCC 100927]|uniref:AsmA family protein n=1 Tax=Reyranella sp. CPCC 100927 TaxID=2599616 RepID=UPI0015B58747|nr:AsmA family protein [Reyranella sp. CPCC 100927]
MKRFLWITVGTLAVLLLAPAGLYLWASSRDLSRYQSQIAEQVRKATGRELVMKGGLRVNFTLSPSAVAEDVVLANAAGGSRPEMARIKRLVLHLDPFSLLLGEIRIGRLQLFGADILIERDGEGRSNLAMEAPVEGSGPHPSEHQSLRIKNTPSLPWISRIEVEGSTVTLKETAERPAVVIVVDRFIGTATQATAPISGEFLGRINSSEALALSLKKAGTFDGWLKGVPGDLDMQGTLGGLPVAVTGQVAARRLEMGVEVEGRSLVALGHILNLPLPETAPYGLKLKLTNPRTGPKLDIAELKIGDSVLRGDMVFRTTKAGKSVIVANLAADKFDLADLKPRPAAPPPPSNGGTAPAASGPSGTAQAAAPPAAPPPPAPPPAPASHPAASDGRVIPGDPYPIEAIKKWNGSFTLRVAEVVGAAVKMQGLSVTLTLNDGKLTLRPAATIGSGQLGIDAQIDASGAGPVLTLTATAAKVPLEDMMTLLGISTGVKGASIDMEVKLRGSGRSLRESLGLAVGNMDFVIGSAQITKEAAHLLTPEWIRMLGLGDRPATLNCAAGKIEFGGRPEGERGAANIRKLVIDAQRFTAIGGGYIHLRNEQIGLLMWPEPRDLALIGAAVPLRLKGSLAQASAESDAAAARSAAGAVPGTRVASLTAAITTAGRAAASASLNACGTVLARLDSLRPNLRAQLPQPPSVQPEYRPPRAAPRRGR